MILEVIDTAATLVGIYFQETAELPWKGLLLLWFVLWSLITNSLV